jgi:uncharacterized protein (DUF2345 family)
MPKDFQSQQLRAARLIGSRSMNGVPNSGPSLLIYSASAATDFAGSFEGAMLTNAGTDVFLFVSGTRSGSAGNAPGSGQEWANRREVTVFGGDTVISGALYLSDQVSGVEPDTGEGEGAIFSKAGTIYFRNQGPGSTAVALTAGAGTAIGWTEGATGIYVTNKTFNVAIGKAALSTTAELLVGSGEGTETILIDAHSDYTGSLAFSQGGGATSAALVLDKDNSLTLVHSGSDEDIIFKVNDGGTLKEVFRLDGSEPSLKIADGIQLQLGATQEYLVGDGTDIHFGVGTDGNINIPSDIGLTFGNDGEIIEGDGTNLSIKGGSITLDSEGTVTLDSDGGQWDFDDNTAAILRITSDITGSVRVRTIQSDADIIFTNGTAGVEIARLDTSAQTLALDTGKKLTFDGNNSQTEAIIGDGTNLHLSSSNAVMILSGALSNAGADFDEADSTDINFFVSGSAGSKDGSARGTSLFGGDLVVSGNVYLALSQSHAESSTLGAGSDVNFFVSGTMGSKGGTDRGTAAFGGDLVVSGNVYLALSQSDGNNQLTNLGPDVNFYVSGAEGSRDSSTSKGTSVFGGDLVVSGGLLVGGSNFRYAGAGGMGGTISGSIHHTSGGISYLAGTRGATITSASNGQITVSINDSIIATLTGSTFTGPVHFSGSVSDFTATGSVNFNAGLSGSLTSLVDGTSYLAAGTNIIITSASNGQVVINSSGGGEGDVGWVAASNEIISTTGSVYIGVSAGTTAPDIILSGTGDAVFNEQGSDVDFRVESDNKTHAFFVDGSSDQVLILSGGSTQDTDFNVHTWSDTNFFVSGTLGSRNSTDTKGTSVFGGDLLISGTSYATTGISGSYLETGLVKATTGDLVLNADGGNIIFKDGTQQALNIDMDDTSGDAVFKDADDVEIFRIDGSENSLLMATTKKIQFYDTGIFAHANANGEFTLSSDGASADAINITTSNAAGGIDIDAGTGGIAVDTASGGAITVNATGAQLQLKTTTSGELDITSAGTLDINSVGLDIDATGAVTIDSTSTIGIGSDDAAAGNISIGTNATARELTLGNSTGDSGITATAGTGGIDIDVAGASGALSLDTAGGAIEIGVNAAAGAINIGTNATAREVTLGNSTGISGITATAGTGGIDIDVAGASGALSLDTAGGDIEIGVNASAGDISVGTNASARTITIGSATGITALVLTSGTGDIVADSADAVTIDAGGVLELNSDGGAINIGNDADAQAINIGTGAAARTITVGELTTVTKVQVDALLVDINAGATGLTLDSAGTFSIDGVGTSNVTTDGALTVSGSTGLNLASDSGEIDLTTRQGNIDINATAGNITVDSGGTFSVDAVGTSNVTTVGTLTVSGSTGLNLASDSGEIDLTTRQGAIDINATAGAVTIDAAAASNLTTSAGDLDVSAAAELDLDGATVKLDSAGQMDITAAAALNITSAAYDVNASGVVGIDSDSTMTLGGSAIDVDADGGKLALDGSGGIDIGVASDVAIDIDSSTLDIDSSGAITIDGTSTFSVDAVGTSNVTTDGALTVSGSTGLNLASDSGEIDLTTRQGNIDINATAGTVDIDGGSGVNLGKAADVAFDIDTAALDIDSSGAITIDGTSTFSVDAVGTSNITTNGALTVSGSTGLNLASDGGEIDLTTREGNIDINATAGNITVDSGGTFSVDAVGTSNVTTNGALTVSGSTGLNIASDSGEIDLTTRTGNVDINATAGTVDIDGATGINLGTAADVAFNIDTAALDIDSSGAITIDGTSTFSVDAVGASNVTTIGSLTVSGSEGLNLASHGGEIDLTATQGLIDINATAGAIDIDAGTTVDIDGAGGINLGKASDVAFDIDTATLDIDSSGAITIDGTSTFSVDAVGTSNVTTDGALTVSGSTGLNLASDSGEIDVTARQGAIDINATAGAVTIDAGAASNFATTAGALTLHGAGGINIGTTSDVAVDLDSAALDIDSSGAITIDSTSTFSVDAVGTSNVTTNGTLTVSGSTGLNLASHGGEIDITATQGAIDINAIAGAVTIDAGGAVSLDAAAASNLTTSVGDLDVSAAAELDLDGATVKFDSAGQMDITAVAALNIVSAAYDVNASGVVGIDSDSTMTLGGSAIDIDADGGKLALDGSGGIDIGVATDVAIDIDSSTLDIDASDAITIDGTAGISLDAATASNFTTSGGVLTLESGKTGAGALLLSASHAAGGVRIDAGTGDLVLNSDDQVLILSGGGATSTNEASYTDTNFFVSGAIGSRSSASTKGTAVFGGDMVVSGTLYADSIVVEIDESVTGSLSVSGSLFVSQSVLIYEGLTVNEIGEGGTENDTRIESINKTHAFFVDSSTDQVLILSGGGDGTDATDEAAANDVAFYVSGTVHSRGTSVRGTSLFGGDVDIKGDAFVAKNFSVTEDLFLSGGMEIDDLITFVNPGGDPESTMGTASGVLEVKSLGMNKDMKFYTSKDGTTSYELLRLQGDTNFAVGVGNWAAGGDTPPGYGGFLVQSTLDVLDPNKSPDGDRDDPNDYQLCLRGDADFGSVGIAFAGDGGGATYGVTAALISTGTGTYQKGEFFIANKQTNAQSTDPQEMMRFTDSGQTLFMSGASVSVFGATNENSPNPRDFTDTNFWVSGTVGSRASSNKGTAVFGGDLVISGNTHAKDGLTVFGASGLSGSLTHLSDGTSYLIAGDNVSITSGTNGSVTIASTGGGGGSGTAVGWIAAADGKISTTGSVYFGVASGVTSPDIIFLDGGSATFNDQGAAAADFRIESDLKQGAFLVDGGTDQVGLLTDGTTAADAYGLNASTDPIPADTALFVSGAIGAKNSSNKGTAVFGGDLVISGVLQTGGADFHSLAGGTTGGTISGSIHHTSGGLSYLVPGGNVTITSASNGQITIDSIDASVGWIAPSNGLISTTGSVYFGVTSGQDFPDITFGIDGAAVFNEQGGAVNFRIESNTKENALFVKGSTDQVLILSGGAATSEAGYGTDTNFFVSGAMGGIGLADSKSTSVFGGDLLVSGAVSLARSSSMALGTFKGLCLGVGPSAISTAYDTTDAAIWFSGSVGGKDSTSDRGVSVFAGDLAVSGSLLPGLDITSDLGSPTNRWRNVYTGDLHLRNERGNWTIVEEEDFLCVINNATGKKFKMVLEPLD